jgi:DNA-binding NtrC family response regulator/tetratricopeptide (TPR) repeat protein
VTPPVAHPVDRLDGQAPAIVALRAQIRHLVAFDAVGGPAVPTLLLQGETGTGKGLVARIVHDSGPRTRGPFIPVNCAAIPETMLEAELFGFEAGAFTDARRGKPGLFDAASGGTLFLDEIDSLSLALQSKLLTAIESRCIRRLGAVVEHPVDVKLIAASQHELAGLAAAGRFRPDLYHRLAVVVLSLPPLRERSGDAVLLARALLARFTAAYRTAPKRLSAEAEAWLGRYQWPGNVRELGHLMERVTLLHQDGWIGAAELERLVTPMGEAAPPPPVPTASSSGTGEPPTGVADEAAQIRAALARTGGNVLKTARLLGVSRDAIRYRMRRHGIGRPALDAPPPRAVARPPTVPPDAPAATPAADTESAVPGWEQKPVAIVAVELLWAEPRGGEPPSHEPWTEAARWERLIGEKLAGFGGVLVQRNPSLLVWAFGVPRALEQVAQRAVHGACAVRNLTAALTQREYAPEIRIAVHLGAMVVNTTAADPVAGALPVGSTLTMPIRLLARTHPGEILASEAVARRVEAWVELEALEPAISGDRGDGVFRIAGLSPWRERGAEGRRRPLRGFVGREAERAALDQLLDAAASGVGQVLGIVGEPGAGKSRLLYEFHQAIRERPVSYVETHCLAHGTATPYLPIIEALRAYLELAESDSQETIADKLRTGLAALDLDPAAHAPQLLALLGTGGETDEGQQRKSQTFETIRAMAFGLARQRPLVLAIENVHWIDPTSEECLALLAASISGAPLVLIMTYRPGYRPPWLGHSYASQLALRPLSVDASRHLLRSVVGDAPLQPAVEAQVLSRAEGNPFFLEELGRAVIEHGGLEPLAVPDTVQAVLAARIDRLAADDKRLLQTAAVIGRTVPRALLERVSGLSEAALAPRLARLVAGEFLLEAGRRGEGAYAFKHALTQAAAYAGLRSDVRRGVHRQVAEALESQTGTARPEQVEQLAHHAAEGGSWSKAVGYLRQAAGIAAARGARREVVACYERARTILDKLPVGSQTREEQDRDVRFLLAHALYMAGEFARARDGFHEARALADGAGDRRRLSQILAGLSYLDASEGRYAEAAHAGEQALAIAVDDIAVSLWTSFGLARSHFALGNYRRAAECARWAIEALAPFSGDERFGGRAGNLLPAVAARSWLALSLARTGDLGEGIRHGEDGVRAAESVDGLQERVWAYYCLGRVHHARTDFERAIPLLRQALTLAEGGTVPIYFTRVLSGLGSALYQSGDIDGALPLLQRALAEAGGINLLYGRSLIMVQLGEAFLAAGRLDEAEARAADALACSRQRCERGDEAWALLLQGEIAAARGALDRARGWLHQALAVSEELGMRPLAAQCRMARGALELRAAHRGEARAWLEPALADLRGMGITRWVTRVERLLAEAAARPRESDG